MCTYPLFMNWENTSTAIIILLSILVFYLGNEEQSKCDCDGNMGVCEGEQQHPVRMERGKGEPAVHRQPNVSSHFRLQTVVSVTSSAAEDRVDVYLMR